MSALAIQALLSPLLPLLFADLAIGGQLRRRRAASVLLPTRLLLTRMFWRVNMMLTRLCLNRLLLTRIHWKVEMFLSTSLLLTRMYWRANVLLLIRLLLSTL